MEKFWMVLVEGTGGCSVKHLNRTEAMEEAERLARQEKNIGKRVDLLEAVGYACVEKVPVKWVNLYDGKG